MNHDITATHFWTVHLFYFRATRFPVFNGREIKMPKDLPINLRMKIYDNLYRKMEKLLEKYNPCERRVENGITRCVKYKDISICCNNKKCKYLTSEGCGVKNLMCKLHICDFNQPRFKDKHPALWKRWVLWHIMIYELDLNRGWASRKEVKQAVKRVMK